MILVYYEIIAFEQVIEESSPPSAKLAVIVEHLLGIFLLV